MRSLFEQGLVVVMSALVLGVLTVLQMVDDLRGRRRPPHDHE